MKKTTFTFLLGVLYCCSYAQNPASPIKDNSLSMPEKTFEVFWQTFEDNYAFFKLRNIDWKTTYKKYRSKVGPATTGDSLFLILSHMVAPFKDDHVNIIIPGKREFTSRKPSQFLKEFPDKVSKDALWTVVNTTLYKNGFDTLKSIGPEYRSKKLFYYSTSGTYGYIRIERCFVSDETADNNKADSALANKIFNSVLQQMNSSKAIILDIRTNIGGNDEFAYAVAGHFLISKILGHLKQTRITGTKRFTELEKWYVTPQTNAPYTKPVILLTNDQTASAGDVLAMVMKAMPQVTLIGENSLGIYSDMYGFELPNKWLVSLSNQKYFSSKNVCYEGKGAPVDIKVQNTKKDLQTMSDPVVSAAISYLGKK